ncbi:MULTISPECIES: hypothetical protein [Methylotuvimicrobium]|uniref:Uncharacterized protein n=2 Tax=Methylotuvimicrobium TaxID=2822410 RepID=G4STN8_META2|nr:MULTISPECIES: hypothetical protein [Methylotuvimicrobium]QCW80821.1 hypothetical protein EQU24_00035 [Methylotuvimicrobium buryatense]CCE21710.1 conserved exported protein of unknown function [Methylotuvimicrobium alcaliphilum 20Z]
MSTPFKTALVIFLVILQSIAPLVHAHPMVDELSDGVHMPGFEQFNAANDDDALALFDASVIDLDQGIETETTLLSDWLPFAVVFVAFVFPEPDECLGFEVAFSPPPNVLSGRTSSSPQAPRAPPVQL